MDNGHGNTLAFGTVDNKYAVFAEYANIYCVKPLQLYVQSRTPNGDAQRINRFPEYSVLQMGGPTRSQESLDLKTVGANWVREGLNRKTVGSPPGQGGLDRKAVGGPTSLGG